jgi:hypothetical protein
MNYTLPSATLEPAANQYAAPAGRLAELAALEPPISRLSRFSLGSAVEFY